MTRLLQLVTLGCVSFLAQGLYASPHAYVTNSGDGTVSVIDTFTNAVIGTATVGTGAFGVAVGPDGSRVYVTDGAQQGGTLTVIDGTLSVSARISVGRVPTGVAVTPDGAHLYVANLGDNSVSVIDTASDRVIATLAVGEAPLGVTVNAQGTRVYVTNSRNSAERRPCSTSPVRFCGLSISVIDTASQTVISEIIVPSALNSSFSGVAVDPTQDRLYVRGTAFSNGDVTDSLFEIQVGLGTNAIAIGQTSLGEYAGVAVNPSGTRAYAANRAARSVSVIDMALRAVVATVPLASDPRGLSLTPDAKHLYVATWPDSVVVIDTEQNVVTTTIPVGNLPIAFGQFIGPPVSDPTPTPDLCGGVCDGRFCNIAGVAGNCLPTATGCACISEVTPTSTPRRTSTPTPTFRFGEGPTPTTPRLSPCLGDCDADGRVSINEIIMAINISLDMVSLDACRPCDGNIDGLVTVDELVKAVGNALRACPS